MWRNSNLPPYPSKLVKPERSRNSMLTRNFLHSEQVEIVVENERFDGDEVYVEGSV